MQKTRFRKEMGVYKVALFVLRLLPFSSEFGLNEWDITVRLVMRKTSNYKNRIDRGQHNSLLNLIFSGSGFENPVQFWY